MCSGVVPHTSHLAIAKMYRPKKDNAAGQIPKIHHKGNMFIHGSGAVLFHKVKDWRETGIRGGRTSEAKTKSVTDERESITHSEGKTKVSSIAEGESKPSLRQQITWTKQSMGTRCASSRMGGPEAAWVDNQLHGGSVGLMM